jgi:hypothetical protein
MMKKLVFGAALCTGILMTIQVGASASAPHSNLPLSGQWGGDRLILTLDAAGGRIEMDCANGTLSGPVILGTDGKFQAVGTFTPHGAGPARADEKNNPASARFSGEVTEGDMKLSIFEASGPAPKVFNLRQGARVKLIRCL